MSPDDAFTTHQRQPYRLTPRIRAFLIITGGILSSIAGVIGFLVFLIIF